MECNNYFGSYIVKTALSCLSLRLYIMMEVTVLSMERVVLMLTLGNCANASILLVPDSI